MLPANYLWSQRSVLIVKFSVLTFLMTCFDEHWVKNVQRENNSIPIYIEYVLIRGLWSIFLCILSDLDIRLEQSKNENHQTIPDNLFKFAGYDKSYTNFCARLINPYGLVVKASCSVSGDISSNLQGAETLCCPIAIFRGAEPVCGLTYARFYIDALSVILSFSISSADRALSLNMNIQLP